MVYTSQSLALAALEVLVHVDRDILPVDLVQCRIDLPDDLIVSAVDVAALPADWRTYPAPPARSRSTA